MPNLNRKESRKRRWATGQERKRQRQEKNEMQRLANLERKARGELTPWEQAKAKAKKAGAVKSDSKKVGRRRSDKS